MKKFNKVFGEKPIICASGIWSRTPEEVKKLLPKYDAVITKTCTRLPQKGNAAPNLVDLGDFVVNSIGLANDGYEFGPLDDHPRVLRSFAPFSPADIGFFAAKFARIEFNISCPNIFCKPKNFGLSDAMREISKHRNKDNILGVKISIHTDLNHLTNLLEKYPVDFVTMYNSIPSIVLDGDNNPIMSTVTGGYSGKENLYFARYGVHNLNKKINKNLNIAIIGCGGIKTPEDAETMFAVGANGVQIGSANLT